LKQEEAKSGKSFWATLGYLNQEPMTDKEEILMNNLLQFIAKLGRNAVPGLWCAPMDIW
jgi:hypothetical protein